MKTKILLVSFFAFVGSIAYAQSSDSAKNKECNARLLLGISGGYTHNSLTTSVGYRPFTAYESMGGFTVGVPVVYQFAGWVGLQTEPSVIRKSYRWTRTEFYALDPILPYQETKNTYLQLPLMARFSFGGENLRGFCTPGAFAGYWAGSRINGVTDNEEQLYEYDEPFEFDTRRDNRFEYGLSMGLGLEYNCNNVCTFALEGRYLYSLSDLQKDYMKQQIPRYNNTIVVQASVLFNLF
ncbi:MAG: PorT family protein [Bacteroidetes bacterium]|nr:PorT family protein [Bacteroidota bacterium]